MPATSHNVYEIMARREKAEKLYLALARAGATLEQLRLMGDKEWALAAKAAGCHLPSAATRRLVIELAEERCAAMSIASDRTFTTAHGSEQLDDYNFSAEIADGLADIEAAMGYRPTAEEEDAAAGLDEDYDRVYEDRCDYVR